VKIPTLRRATAAAIAPALAAGMVVSASSAQADTAPSSYSYSAARWLADQLTDGLVVAGGNTYYGQTLDLFFALDGLGVRASTANGILDAFEEKQGDYTTGESFGDVDSHYAGATAKLATAVQAGSREAESFGGHDLVAELEALVRPTGDDQGRVSDVSAYGDNSNAIGQSFAVRALATASSNKLADATAYLLKQQCSDGAFRTFMYTVAVADPDYPVDPIDRVCGEGPTTGDDSLSVDATAYGLQALLEAEAAGTTGLDDDIADAISWLKGAQNSDGSFSDLGTANASSTGLAATTLKRVDEPGVAGRAASWLVRQQVTDAAAEDTALANELGAIAPDSDSLADGKTDGIPSSERLRWVIATAQAATGVNAQLPAATLAVKAPTGYVQGGKKATVTVTGLAKGEKFTATVAGGGSVSGVAGTTGTGSVALTVPTTTGTKAVAVVGSRVARTGSVNVKVLGAKTLAPKLKYTSVKRGGSQKVTVSGLAAGESIKVYQGSTLKKSGAATSTGTYSTTFTVGSSKGTKTVKVVGAFSNRTGTKNFKVT
jgi:hypothetical protein